MQKTRSPRVAEQSTQTRRPRQMTVLIRGKPPTYNWGWFSREDQRMHLQSVDKDHWHYHYKVWLEKNGKRVFEPATPVPAKVLRVLQDVLAIERGKIEAYWISFMIQNGWLKAGFRDGIITLYAYSNTPNHFERTILLSDIIRNEEVARKVTAQDIALNEEFAMLEIFARREIAARMHVRLEDILWGG